MKLIGLMLARNEGWIIGLTARAALRWCDALVVLDHDSTDRTPDILDEIEAEEPGRLIRARIDDGGWREMEHRQITLNIGRDVGGTHFAICDADELVTGNYADRIKADCETLGPGDGLSYPMVAVWGSLRAYRTDSTVWGRAKLTLAFRDDPGLSWIPAADGYQFHSRPPAGRGQIIQRGKRGEGGVMHLQFLQRERLIAKHAWYKMHETLTWPGRMSAKKLDHKYSQAVIQDGVQLGRIPDAWWERWSDIVRHIDLGAPDWRREECKAMMAKHGHTKFKGLKLWGVA